MGLVLGIVTTIIGTILFLLFFTNFNTVANSYFLFQAQKLDLPSLAAEQVLTGHIVESKIGAYESKNIIVKTATFRVKKVLLNIPNPFLTEVGK